VSGNGRLPSRTVDASHYSDEQLVGLAADASDAALGELYDRFGRVAYGLAMRVIRDTALAEDAVQAAFLDVWRCAGRFKRDRASAAAWILMLVHRRAVDVVRGEQRRSALAPGHAAWDAAEASDEEAFRRISRARVGEMLCRLGAEERQAIELAYYDGFTQSEIAERLDVPLGTVKSRTFRGLSRLRHLLSEDGLASARHGRPAVSSSVESR
jgi:RNA polymerase sigma factor (sigma-70 family)